MSFSLPDGSTLAIASAYDDSVTMSALTNASPAVATLSAVTGISAGDFLEITSGWEDLNSRIVKVGTVDTDNKTVELSGIDASDTDRFPAGSGTGTVRMISTWEEISQILTISGQGGDQNFVTVSTLASKNETQIPSTRSAASFQLTIADDSSLSFFSTLQTADDDRDPRALKLTLPSGDVIVYNAYITLSQTPTVTKGQVISRTMTASFLAIPVRYSAS